MKTSLAAAIVIIVLIALGAGAIYLVSQQKAFRPQSLFKTQTSPIPTPVAKFPTISSPAPKIQPESGSNTAGISIVINVQKPIEGETILSPLKVKGSANVPAQQVTILIKDTNGQILGQGIAAACLDLNPCPFEASIVFAKSSTRSGTVEVSSEDYLQTIPVYFQ